MVIQQTEEQALDEIRRLIPILGKEKAAKLESAYLLWDEDGKKRIIDMVDALKASVFSDKELKESVLIESPAKEIAVHGDFPLGSILYGKKELYPLFLNKNDLLTHIGIFGSSGSGKTNAVHYLSQVLNSLEVPILIFDFSKRNYRDMLEIPELKDKIKVYTIGRNVVPFRFNPLKPPEGVQISQWAKEFAEVFDHAYWLMGGGRYVILKALDELYKKYEPNYPKIADIKSWVARYSAVVQSARERNWVATAQRPLESLCFRETGEIFDCDEGLNPEEFFEKGKITILELDSLSNDDKTFFIEILLQWIRDWLIVKNIREKLFGVIILEEAHHVLNREKTKRFGVETVTDLIFREIRELGIGMIYVDQHPSLVSYPALGNTSTHVYMNLGLDTKQSSDIQDATNMLGLSTDEEGDYLRRLPTGHGFILIRKSIFPNPFLIKFPLIPLERGLVNDEMLRKFMEEKLLQEIKKPDEIVKELTRETKHLVNFIQDKENIEKRMSSIDSIGWQIIEILAKSQACYASAIYKILNMSGQAFKKYVQKLIDMGFVGFRKAKVYKQKAVFYFLTHNGELAYILRTGRLPEEKSDIELDETTKDFLVNYMTLQRFNLVDRNLDKYLLFEKDGRKIMLNFVNETRRNQLYQDIDKCAMDGEVYFVCSNENVRNRVVQQAAKYCSEHRRMNLILFVATLDELKNEGELRKIEFIAG